MTSSILATRATAAALRAGMTLAAFMVLPMTQAYAQAIERNLPPQPAPSDRAALTVDQADYGKGDDTPLGVDVTGVRLIGADEGSEGKAPDGISLGRVVAVENGALQAALSPYLGKPLTRGAIARMQATVSGLWRDAGHPFMSVTVPPQEVTSGVLRLRVVEFQNAGTGAIERNLAPQVRFEAGKDIDASALEEDLDWLNRNPFRHVEGVFAPGADTGASDMTLTVTNSKPYSLFASYADTGSLATGRDRWSTGFGLWLPELNDMTLAYRFTGSDQAFALDGDGPLRLQSGKPGYLSHAASITLPTFSRQTLSIAPNYVETEQTIAGTPFSFRNRTFELPILYRSAISNILPGRYWGDVYFGVEPKWVRRATAFDGIEVATGRAGLFNLVLGWADDVSDRYGRTAVDVRLKVNPGGIVSGNTAADWTAFTGGRVTDNTYVTAGLDISRTTVLPAGFAWSSQLSGLIANQALPDTERLGLGGFYAVRGYDNDDGAGDAGLVWRNELRLPALSPLAKLGAPDTLSPFLFVDLGYGHDFAARANSTLASAGLGLDYAIATNLSANFTTATALKDATLTRAGDWTFYATIRVAY